MNAGISFVTVNAQAATVHLRSVAITISVTRAIDIAWKIHPVTILIDIIPRDFTGTRMNARILVIAVYAAAISPLITISITVSVDTIVSTHG